MPNMKTLVVIRGRQQSRLAFCSVAKAKAECGPTQDIIGEMKQYPSDGSWRFHPAAVILSGISRSEMEQIAYQMEQ